MELLNDWVSGEIYGSEEDLKDFVVDLQEPYSRPYRIQFDENAGYPKYWILPLSNFCCPFCQKKDSLRTHPLRINKDDRIIIYKYSGEDGFIEPLPDYEEREKALTNGEASIRITAILVGSINSKHIHHIDILDVIKWLPCTFLPLLGFSVGNDISAPCIELRDSECKLVRRIIVQLEKPVAFSKGRAVIDEDYNTGIGQLLTRLSPDYLYDTDLRVILKHITRGGLDCHDFEEKMSYIIRGFDCLGEKFKLGTQQLTKYLDTNQKDTVRTVLKESFNRIRVEAQNAENAGQLLQSSCLSRIADRALNAWNTDRNFGLEVTELLTKYGFPDAEIAAKYYNSQNSRTDWITTLNKYRGRPMHPGYFDFESEFDIKDVSIVARHLQDILIRIILKELRYDGTYRPTIFIPENVTLSQYAPDGFIAEWVTPSTPAFALGYATEQDYEEINRQKKEFKERIRKILLKRIKTGRGPESVGNLAAELKNPN